MFVRKTGSEEPDEVLSGTLVPLLGAVKLHKTGLVPKKSKPIYEPKFSTFLVNHFVLNFDLMCVFIRGSRLGGGPFAHGYGGEPGLGPGVDPHLAGGEARSLGSHLEWTQQGERNRSPETKAKQRVFIGEI